MPTQNFTSLGGAGRPKPTTSGVNTCISVIKAGSATNSLIDTATVSSPSAFFRNSNAVISTTTINGTGFQGQSIHYASGSPSAFGVATQIRKKAEASVSNRMFGVQDGINNKQSDTTPLIQGTGIRILRDGRYVSVTGGLIPVGSGFQTASGTYVLVAASGTTGYGDNAATPGRLRGQNYLFRQGAKNNNINLGIRTQ